MDADCADSLLVVEVLVTALLAAFLVVAAYVISRARASRIAELTEAGLFGANFADKLLAERERFGLSAQLGVLVSSGLVGALTLILSLRARSINWAFADNHPNIFSGLLFVAGLFMLAIFIVAIAAALRAIFFRDLEKGLCWTGIILYFALNPLVILFSLADSAVSILLSFLGRSQRTAADTPITAEELSEIVEHSGEAGEIEEDEREMIQNVFEFSETVVREIMTPRREVAAVPLTASLEEVCHAFRDSARSRLVVYGSDLDDVKGVLLFKDLLPFVGRKDPSFQIAQLMREPRIVREDVKVSEMFPQLKVSGIHFAIVVEDHGGLAGVVTIEDMVEEIVGEIIDEHDRKELPALMGETIGGDLLVEGGILIADLNAEYGFEFPIGDYDTIAGFVIHRLGRLPDPGDSVHFGGLVVTVDAIEQNRIAQVRISVLRPESDAAPAQAVYLHEPTR